MGPCFQKCNRKIQAFTWFGNCENLELSRGISHILLVFSKIKMYTKWSFKKYKLQKKLMFLQLITKIISFVDIKLNNSIFMPKGKKKHAL